MSTLPAREPIGPEAGPDARFARILDQQPAVIGRLCRWGRPSSEDLAAEVLALVHEGVILVEEDSRVDARGKRVGDYRLTVVAEKAQACMDPIEQATLKLLFGVVGEAKRSLLCGDLHLFARMKADAFSRAVRSWQAVLSEEVRRLCLISRLSLFLRMALPVTAGFTVLAGFLGLLATGELLSLLACAVVAVTLLAFNVCTPWLSSRGSALMGDCRRLHEALKAGQLAGTRALCDGSLMPYAMVLRQTGAALRQGERLAEWRKWYELGAGRACDGKGDSAGAGLEGAAADASCDGLVFYRCFADELSMILSGAAFAAESIIAQQSVRALNSSVNAAMGGGPAGVAGLGNPHVDAGDLFAKRPSRRG